MTTWDDFIQSDTSMNLWLDYAAYNKDHKDDFDLHLDVDKGSALWPLNLWHSFRSPVFAVISRHCHVVDSSEDLERLQKWQKDYFL